MENERKLICPGDLGNNAACDARRCEFDIMNEQIFYTEGTDVAIDFIGDSITHFMEHCQFYNKYGFVINRGIGGDETQFVEFRFDADVIQLKPRLCILCVGCNNLWVLEDKIDPETGDYMEEEKVKVINTILTAYTNMLEKAKAAGIPLWVCSILPHSKWVGNFAIRNPLIARINGELKALSEKYDTEFVDYFSNLTDEDGMTMKEGISREGIHPNHAGYELMRQVLQPKLDKFFGME